MEEIKIDNAGEKITYESKEDHDENSLLDKYQEQFIALKVQEKQEAQTPQIIAQIKMYMTFSEESIRMNHEKQERLKKIFEELDINIPKRIKKIKEKYSDEELMLIAQKQVQTQKTIIVKEGDKYVYRTEVTQSVEDLLIDFMQLQESLPGLIERLAKQQKEFQAREKQLLKIKDFKVEIKERLDSIRDFFFKQQKDVDKLLDARAQARKKGQSQAQALPAPKVE